MGCLLDYRLSQVPFDIAGNMDIIQCLESVAFSCSLD